MKKINLYFDFEFTSLSPDAQPISLGIVSDEMPHGNKLRTHKSDFGNIDEYEAGTLQINDKSFYAEFSDFDINRCDDWVKENVVSKLKFPSLKAMSNSIRKAESGDVEIVGDTESIQKNLIHYLKQFSDYEIQFICDCGTYDWYWMVQLLAEWDETPSILIIEESALSKYSEEELIKIWRETPSVLLSEFPSSKQSPKSSFRIGLPKLPTNISPVPQDLNDLIAFSKKISPKEAFELSREGLISVSDVYAMGGNQKHNALWDAKVIKEVFNKLSQ